MTLFFFFFFWFDCLVLGFEFVIIIIVMSKMLGPADRWIILLFFFLWFNFRLGTFFSFFSLIRVCNTDVYAYIIHFIEWILVADNVFFFFFALAFFHLAFSLFDFINILLYLLFLLSFFSRVMLEELWISNLIANDTFFYVIELCYSIW